MTTAAYSERSTQLALEASVAVMVLANAQCDDVEMLELRPRQLAQSGLTKLRARWPGRGLRSIGVIGLVGASPRCEFKEQLDPEQVSALVDEFLAYAHRLFCDGFTAQQEAELRHLLSLPDPRVSGGVE